MAAAAVQRPAVPPPPQQRYQGVQKDSAGYRLLSAMGWREGEGLGACKQGIKSHIKVKKKFENWGVGAVEAAQHTQNWTNGMLDFHRVLSNLSEVVSEHARRRSDTDTKAGGSTRASSSDSEEESDAAGGMKLGEQQAPAGKARSVAGKKRKQARVSDDIGAGSREQPSDVAAAPKRVKAATHIGRFKKREAAKMVRGYSQHDLAAILGQDPWAAAAPPVPEVRALQQQQDSSSRSDSDSDGGPAGEGKQQAALLQQQASRQQQEEAASHGRQQPDRAAQQAQQQQQQQQQQEVIVVRRPILNTQPVAPGTPPVATDQAQAGWWQVCFHRAAGPGIGGAGPSSAVITIHGFREQDQTNLYNLAQDKASQGRGGLGRSSMPKKVAGARWQGTKTRIQDSDEEEEEGEQQAAMQQQEQQADGGMGLKGAQLEREEGLVIILPTSKRHLLHALQVEQTQSDAAYAQQQQDAAAIPAKKAKKSKQQVALRPSEATQAESTALASISWKKAVAAALKASSKGRLRLSKLHKTVVREQRIAEAHRAAALQALIAFLQQSTKFKLDEGVVRRV